MKELFPVFLDLTSQKCLVIGGGAVAERKVKLLLSCQAQVYVVSPDLTAFLQDLVEQSRIIYYARKFIAEDSNEKFLIISAAGDKEVNNYLNGEYLNKRFLLNIVDEPDKGNFFVPATVKRGKLQIAISTAGASPLLARKLRERLEQEFGPEYKRFVDILADVRKEVLSNVTEPHRRQQIFKELVDSDVLELLRDGNDDKVEERINKCLS